MKVNLVRSVKGQCSGAMQASYLKEVVDHSEVTDGKTPGITTDSSTSIAGLLKNLP